MTTIKYAYATTTGRIYVSNAGQSDTVAPDPKVPGPSPSDTAQDWSPWHLMSTKVAVVDRSKDHADNLVLIVWTWLRNTVAQEVPR
jgi:hypothetical protein